LHGGGTSVKSFVHVRDVVRGLLLALERGGPGAYHFSVPSDRSVAEVVRTVCAQMGRDFESATRMVGERLGQDSRYTLDCTRAHEELGWRPEIAFQDGVRETVDWIEANWATICEMPLVYQHKT
jgi:dTDP-glucose 4,6-dehydratase